MGGTAQGTAKKPATANPLPRTDNNLPSPPTDNSAVPGGVAVSLETPPLSKAARKRAAAEASQNVGSRMLDPPERAGAEASQNVAPSPAEGVTVVADAGGAVAEGGGRRGGEGGGAAGPGRGQKTGGGDGPDAAPADGAGAQRRSADSGQTPVAAAPQNSNTPSKNQAKNLQRSGSRLSSSSAAGNPRENWFDSLNKSGSSASLYQSCDSESQSD